MVGFLKFGIHHCVVFEQLNSDGHDSVDILMIATRSSITSWVHLMVHIIQDMVICCLVSNICMLFLECFMKTFKDFMR
jgi:hypothetical protein